MLFKFCFSCPDLRVLHHFDQTTRSLYTFNTLCTVSQQHECSRYSNMHVNQFNTILNEKSGHSILVMVQSPVNFSENNRLLLWTEVFVSRTTKIIYFTEYLGISLI